ncbi:MAG: protease modulator HflK N-terminal domain-containing protein, partial [Hyphomicrobium sp.]
MPWNNQSGGGGWKGGGNGGGPWGQGPTGGGGQPPDLEEMLKRGQDKVKQVMHGGGVPGPLLFLVAIVAGAIIAWQAFTFRVQPDEV